jgi:N-acetylmuramoyl-L-alanine amidase
MRTGTILAVVIALLAAFPAQAREKRLKVIRSVVVDPGHGGDNKGALAFNGVYEKEIVLAIGKRVVELLEAGTNAEGHLTRQGDETVPLKRRIAMANDLQADLFISLHCNSSFSQKPAGVETYVLSEEALEEESNKLSRQVVTPRGLYASAADPAAAAVVKEMLQFAAHRDAKGFASRVQGALVRRTRSADRGVKELPIVILRGAEMPGVVIEVGFVSNPVEAENLSRSGYQEKVAQAIVDAIISYDEELSRKRLPGKVAGSPSPAGTR